MAVILDEAAAALLDEAGADIFDEAGPPPPVGSWWGLHSVIEHRRQEAIAYDSRPPTACPNDGQPLLNAPSTKSGSGVQLYCPYDGWQFPRDWQPDVHPGVWA